MGNIKFGKMSGLLVPILSVILGFVLGAIIMLIFGYNPVQGYQAMLDTAFQSPRSVGEIFVQAGPLIFTALGFSVASAAGFFNIGLSGQALAGWVASIWVGLSLGDTSRLIALPAAILAGVLAGAIAAAIPGLLRAYFGTSEVIVTIMMNYILLYMSTHIINNVIAEQYISTKGTTKMVGPNATLRTQFLTDLSQGSRLNLGIILAFAFLIIIWFLMNKTTLGYEIKSVGLNPYASEYAGMNSKRIIVLSMMISGALAGLGGVVYGLGTFGNFFIQGSSLSIGFDGIAVALLGGGTSIGILLSALLFSVLKLGGQGMPIQAGVPTELVDVVIALIIFFVGSSYIIKYTLNKVQEKKEHKKLKDQEVEGGKA